MPLLLDKRITTKVSKALSREGVGEEYLKIEAADDLKEAADARVYPVEMRGLVRVQRHGVF